MNMTVTTPCAGTAPAVPPSAWFDLPVHRTWLSRETLRLLEFHQAALLPGGGAAYLNAAGEPDTDKGVQTWITSRTVHSFSLGHLLGVPGSAAVADAAIEGLLGVLHDSEHSGWFHAVSADGTPDVAAGKSAYDHAFVMLAGSSAAVAGRPRGAELLTAATEVYLDKFWDEDLGRPVDTWDVTFTELNAYRGVNATMHSVEAMLSVADAVPTDEATAWRERAARAARFVAGLAASHDGRLPEHFGPDWSVDLELNRDRPDDQFKPYGATPGHGLEWARLLVHLDAATGGTEFLPTAKALFDRSVTDGWSADGAAGFVYTTDWSGTPVVRTRMHWVLCEAIGAAAALYRATGDARYADWYATWWDYAQQYLLDRDLGSWHHELDVHNVPTATVWPGKPDAYHALQCLLVPRLPLAPMLAGALRAGLLDHPGGSQRNREKAL